MASIREKLTANIDAIEVILKLDVFNGEKPTPEQQQVLRQYAGFGDLKCILLDPARPQEFAQSEQHLIPLVQRLHDVIRENAPERYTDYINSLKESVLTSFYTPNEVIASLDRAFARNNLTFQYVLDPSAGLGAFTTIKGEQYTLIEKDMLTARILKALYLDSKVIAAGFETVPANQNGTYNLVASNIPFGNLKVYDAAYRNSSNPFLQHSTNAIHTYFFEKGLDMLRDGGILSFITSTGVMDAPGNEYFRQHFLSRAKLISAVRLPENLFDSTKVQSDLIILQRDDRRTANTPLSADEEKFIRVDDVRGDGLYLNAYYHQQLTQHTVATENRIDTDMYGKPDVRYTHSGGVTGIARDMQDILSSDMRQNIDRKLFTAYNIPVVIPAGRPVQLSLFDNFNIYQKPVEQKQKPVKFDYTNDIYHIEGSYQLNGNEIGKAIDGKTAEIITEQDDAIRQLLIDYVYLRDAYFDLKNFENQHLKENPEKRTELNRSYDAFIQSPYFGREQQPSLIEVSNFFKLEPSFTELKGLEYITDGKVTKADIFVEPVAFGREKESYTALEALNVCRNRLNRVDMDYIHSLTGLNADAIARELQGQIYKNPVTMQYETADVFLSGNVYEKYGQAVTACMGNNMDYELIQSRDALQSVIPAKVPFNEIGLNFGERWIPVSYYDIFVSKLLGTDTNVYYNPLIDDFDVKGDVNYYSHKKYAVQSASRYYNAHDVVRFALLDTMPQMTKTAGRGEEKKTVPDTEGIQLMNANIAMIKSEWDTWLLNLPAERKLELENMYNERFNCFVKPQFDGSFQTFPGFDLSLMPFHELYASQKDAILRIKSQNGGIIDHEVGSGKTMIMCCSAYEMKRLGIINKPIIIGIKANTIEINQTFRKIYPDAKILYADPKKFTPKDREEFFNKIQNNNWDCIIMTHEQFMHIPQSLEVERQVTVEELTKIDRSLYALDNDRINFKRAKKALEQRKKTLTVKLGVLNDKLNSRKDNVVDFRTMGIDHIFCDESQKFKNLRVQTRHERVAGIGNTQGSDRSMNMKFAIRDIQERKGRDLCATFVSGTTIVNSLTELYVLFDYMRPRALEKQGIECFDAWAAIYTRKSKEIEFSVTNELIMKERFREFVKVPELSLFYSEITDYMTAEDIGIDRPMKNEVFVTSEQTEVQRDMYMRLKDFAKSGNGEIIFRPKLNSNEQTAKMLIATNTAKKAAVDMRLIDEHRYGEDSSLRTKEVANRAFDYYKKYDEQKGSQFIFSDMGVHHSDDNFSVYNDIKQKLVEKGIPEKEIIFIQDFQSDKKREKLQKDANAGNIRIMIGSTDMLGTGINAQERCVAIHHVNIPWTPKDFLQRNGRGVRKGNRVAKYFANNTVDVLIYATQSSLDTYNFNIVKNKEHFIHQIKNGTANVRTIDEGGMDMNTGMSYGEYIAILSGNNDLLERAKLEKEISVLKSEERLFRLKAVDRDNNIMRFSQELELNNRNLAYFHKDMQEFQTMPRNKDGVPIVEMKIGDKVYTDYKRFGDAINKALDKENRDTVNYQTIGSFGNFKLIMRAEEVTALGEKTYQNHMYVQGQLKYQHNKGFVARTAEIAGKYPVHTLERIEKSLIPQYTEKNAALQRKIDDLKKINCDFPNKDKLTDAQVRFAELDKRISSTIGGGQESIMEMSFNKDTRQGVKM
ncbi:MAG: N-6 DNA methylase [Prevotellaceae bacterium]|jgi:N12 class adenine-specific DNA methylase|nr:N-6 DNA methylase [Prevotellaceae bacterium]